MDTYGFEGSDRDSEDKMDSFLAAAQETVSC
jgi:hypothetical protein